MKDYLLTIYTIKTQVSWIKAETLEDAKQLIADHDDSIHWMEIPFAKYISWSEGGKTIGPNFAQALDAYIEDNHKDNYDE